MVFVKAGDTITLFAWSNVAVILEAHFLLRPKNPKVDPYLVKSPELSVPNTRAQTVLQFVCPESGEIDTATVAVPQGSLPPQRGQCYAWLVNFSATLMRGYIYTGHSLVLGEIQEPGPAGGHGNLRYIATANPAANAEVAPQVPPSGTIWRLHTFSVQLVQGLTQTPLPTLQLLNSLGTVWQIPITQTAIGASSTAQLTWGIGLVQQSFTAVVGDEFHVAPIPMSLIFGDGVMSFQTVTDGKGANTDYGVAVYLVEEWVVPN